jgi:hypothetical protein
MTQLRVEMPEQDSFGEIMKGYLTLMAGLGVELFAKCDRELTELEGEQWWRDLEAQRRADGIWKGRVTREDPSILLPEYVKSHDSPLRRVLSGKPASMTMATKLYRTRNTWLHFSELAGAAQLEEVASMIKQFANMNGLQIEALAARMIRRLQRIRSGQYQPFADQIRKWQIDNEPFAEKPTGAEPAPEVHPDAAPANETGPGSAPAEVEPPEPDVIEIESSPVERRPAIGARWLGDIPTTRYQSSKIGDLVDPTTGTGLRARVGTDQWERKRRLWLAPRPLGGIWLDERDGAVGGFVDNVPRLLGYLGVEPDDGLARGFLTSRFYEVADGRIVDLDSGQVLQDAVPSDLRPRAAELEAAVLASAPAQAGLRLSTYGDLVAITDDGAQRVAVIEPEHWFPGHLA